MLKKLIRSDYVLTFLTEFIVLVAGVLVYKFAANLSGKDDFSEYAICRRTISFIQPLLILGLAVGIPRFIAYASGGGSEKLEGTFFMAGLLVAISILFPSLLIFNVFSKQFSFLFFGDEKFKYLIPYLSIMIAGMIFHALAYSYLRGKIWMKLANLFQLINIGLVPMIVFALFHTVNDVLLYTGLSWLCVSLIMVVVILFKIQWSRIDLRSSLKQLLNYGIQRVPGDLVLAGFLALPTYFTAHVVSDDLKTAGYVAFSMTLLNMAGAAFGPISLILLPKASQAIVKKDFVQLKEFVRKLTTWTIVLTVAGIIFVELFAQQLIEIYLGAASSDLVLCVRIVILASLGYTVYISLRSILDAYYIKAVNTKNIIISFIVFVLLSASLYIIAKDYLTVLYSFVVAMLVLGLLTYSETRKVIRNTSATS
jgi:O-antigen/teichoic acid export membrane protein